MSYNDLLLKLFLLLVMPFLYIVSVWTTSDVQLGYSVRNVDIETVERIEMIEEAPTVMLEKIHLSDSEDSLQIVIEAKASRSWDNFYDGFEIKYDAEVNELRFENLETDIDSICSLIDKKSLPNIEGNLYINNWYKVESDDSTVYVIKFNFPITYNLQVFGGNNMIILEIKKVI